MEETIKRLKTYLLSNQISFHTLKSLEYVKYIETIEVGEENEWRKVYLYYNDNSANIVW